MPYDFHLNPEAKWEQQYLTTKNYIIPFIRENYPLPAEAVVLEVGCGEGGVLKAFCEKGYACYGVDISAPRIENANRIFKEEVASGQIAFYAADVHDTATFEHLVGKVDLLILKDAIEHIHDQEDILRVLHRFVKPGRAVFIAFPPWWNPFGGHQQLADSFLRFVPWFHILPKQAYRGILKMCGENERKIAGLLEVYDTRLPLAKFERLLKLTNWNVMKRQLYLFNPIYEYKFGIKGRRQFPVLSAIPLLRDFVSTGVYYIVRAGKHVQQSKPTAVVTQEQK